MSLGRKQNIKNDAWIAAMADIESAVSRDEIEELAGKTVEDIRAKTTGKKAAYAWSGGKDSIVLSKMCELAGVKDCMIGVCDLEYPAFMAWIQKHKPKKCEVINTGQNLEWLAQHPEMLFPQDSQTAARWFSIVQHRAQREYFKAHDLDMIILTKGIHGSWIVRKEGRLFQPTPEVKVASAVGAGDAFTGAFIGSLLNGATVEEAHRKAVRVSAFVCTRKGAMPKIPEDLR